MKTILDLSKYPYWKRVSIFLIAVGLVVGMASCGGNGVIKYDLTMAIAPAGGGTATDLTNASPYAGGAAVSLEAVAAAGYEFVNWTAAAGGFGNANAAETTFTMPAQDVTVTANFAAIPLDHFKGYATNQEALPPGIVVHLEDQFVDIDATVNYAVAFLNPAEKTHGDVTTPIVNPDNYLTWYTISYEGEPQTWLVQVNNQFGTQNLTVHGPIAFAVPTQKESHEPPEHLDHFLLYEVTAGSSVNVVVDLNDEFGDEPEVLVSSPMFFANPVRKTHGSVVTEIVMPDAHLVFYNIFPETFITEVQVFNQFGLQTLEVAASVFVGVPSEKTEWSVVPP